MSRKGIFSVLVALVAALVVTTAALAAPALDTDAPPAPNKHPHRVGQITAIDGNTLTVEGPQGRTATIQVDDATQFRTFAGDEASFADLAVGKWITGRLEPTDEEGVFHARVVVILPDDFDPAQWKNTERHAGKVTAVGDGSITIQTRDGQTLTFAITDQTRFRSRDENVQSIADIQPDMLVLVVTRKGESDALFIGVGDPEKHPATKNVERHAGKVTAVGGGSITIQTRDGQTLTFTITDQTRFRSRDENVQSIADIQPDMPVLVITREGDNTALLIGVGKPPRP